MPNTAGEWIFQIIMRKNDGETFEQIKQTFGNCLDRPIYDEYFEYHPNYNANMDRLKFVYDNYNIEIEDNLVTTYA
jgi:hypothetical protein